MFDDLQKSIGYKFNNESILKEALTHSSFANEHKKDGIKCNERLEFLGDSVLSVVVASYLFNNFPDYPEGKLTKLRSLLVCEKSLSNLAMSINLGDNLLLSHGEIKGGGRGRMSTLEDAFESLIAAIYLDGGMKSAERFIHKFVIPQIENQNSSKAFNDYKSRLQEIVQKNPGESLSYVLVSESGPDHNKHFVVEVHLNSNVIGRGGGKSKKEAEQQSAREALELMGY